MMPGYNSASPERQSARARFCYRSGNVVLVLALLAFIVGLLGPQVVQFLLDRGVGDNISISVLLWFLHTSVLAAVCDDHDVRFWRVWCCHCRSEPQSSGAQTPPLRWTPATGGPQTQMTPRPCCQPCTSTSTTSPMWPRSGWGTDRSW